MKIIDDKVMVTLFFKKNIHTHNPDQITFEGSLKNLDRLAAELSYYIWSWNYRIQKKTQADVETMLASCEFEVSPELRNKIVEILTLVKTAHEVLSDLEDERFRCYCTPFMCREGFHLTSEQEEINDIDRKQRAERIRRLQLKLDPYFIELRKNHFDIGFTGITFMENHNESI